MLSNDTANRLDHAVTDDKVGDEIAARLISETPADASEAQEVLDILDTSAKMNAAIAERLYTGLAGDAEGRAGREIARKINGMVAVLQAQADGDEVEGSPAVAATFVGAIAGVTGDVDLEADTAGEDGNSIVLTGDGIKDLDTLVSDWNTANPANTVSLNSANGADIPDAAEEMQLAGGADEVLDSDANLAPALAAMGDEPMSDDTYECLKHALGDKRAADEFRAAYDAMVEAVQAIS